MKLSYKYLLAGLLLLILSFGAGAAVYSTETPWMMSKILHEPFKMLFIGIGLIGLSGLLRRRVVR